jgi:hypothetical protein
MNASKTENKRDSQWQKTPMANLVRNNPSENNYARAGLKGKLIWKGIPDYRTVPARNVSSE